MALTAKTQIEMLGPVLRIPGKLAASDTYYKGGIMCYSSSGYLSAAGGIPAGILTGFGFDPADGGAQVVGSGETPDAEIEVGCAWVPFASAAQTDVGEMFYVTDDGTVTKTVGTNTHGVPCRAYKSGYVLLDFGCLVTVDTTS